MGSYPAVSPLPEPQGEAEVSHAAIGGLFSVVLVSDRSAWTLSSVLALGVRTFLPSSTLDERAPVSPQRAEESIRSKHACFKIPSPWRAISHTAHRSVPHDHVVSQLSARATAHRSRPIPRRSCQIRPCTPNTNSLDFCTDLAASRALRQNSCDRRCITHRPICTHVQTRDL